MIVPVPMGAVKLIVTEVVVALTSVRPLGLSGFVVIDSALDALDEPLEFVADNVIEYVVLEDNPEIVYALDVPDPVPALGVYPVTVPLGDVKLIVTELDVALINVRPVG